MGHQTGSWLRSEQDSHLHVGLLHLSGSQLGMAQELEQTFSFELCRVGKQ